MFNRKKGTLKFLLNSCLDTLPTQTNLIQWEKSALDPCKLCLQSGAEMQGRRKETTNHILNGCKVALQQKRSNLRHNNLIKYITGIIDVGRFLMYADIKNPIPFTLSILAEIRNDYQNDLESYNKWALEYLFSKKILKIKN